MPMLYISKWLETFWIALFKYQFEACRGVLKHSTYMDAQLTLPTTVNKYTSNWIGEEQQIKVYPVGKLP